MTTQPAPVVRRATSERSTRNAAAVMKALTQEAIDRGLDGIATSSIAKRAGLTTGAVYSRYENNDEMLIALWESVVAPALAAHVRETIDAIISPSAQPSTELITQIEKPSRLLSLGAEFVADDNSRRVPVMLHRAILGSMERFIGILIEEHAGKLPFWLAPRQVVVAAITSDSDAYVLEVVEQLKAAGVRAEADVRNEKINYKVREHSVGKVPVILAVGAREVEERTVSVRRLGEKQTSVQSLADVTVALKIEATPPDLL